MTFATTIRVAQRISGLSIHKVVDMEKKLKITKKGEDGYTNVSIRLRNDILDKLNDFAAQTNRSRNELINLGLEFAVNNLELNDE